MDVKVGTARRGHGIAVVPLVVTRTSSAASKGGVWVQADCCPAAVLVRDRAGTLRAMAVDGTEYDPRALITAFPDLARVLAAAET